MKYILTIFVLLVLCCSVGATPPPVFVKTGDFIYNVTGDSVAIIIGTDTTWFTTNIVRRGLDTISELGPTIESGEIANQTVVGDDIDSTSENFVFEGAYHITSAESDSAYMSKKYIDDAAGGLTNQSVKGDHVDSTAEDFVFVDPYKGTSAVGDSVLTTRKELGDSSTAIRGDFPGGLGDQLVKGDHIDSTAEDFVFDAAYEGTSVEADSQYSTHNWVQVEIEDSLNEYSLTSAIASLYPDTAETVDTIQGVLTEGGYLTNSKFSDSSIALLNATAWRLFYSNATTTAIQELALGGNGTYLKSNGASANPTWATPGGGLTYWTESDDNDTSVFTATGPNTTVGLNDDLTMQGNDITGVANLTVVTGITVPDNSISDEELDENATFTWTSTNTWTTCAFFDKNSGDSPDLDFVDESNHFLRIKKYNAGFSMLYNNEGHLRFIASNETDDWIYFDSFAAGVPMISTDGNCNLVINASSGEVSFDTANLTTTGTLDVGATSVTGNITVSGTVDGVDVAAFNTDVAADSGSWNATADALGTAITTGKITDQTIVVADIDTTASNFVFDGAYHITSAVADSQFMSKKYIDDAAGGLVAQSVKGDHVDSTAENFVFDDPYKGTSAIADSVLTTRKELGDSSTAIRGDFPGGLGDQLVKGDHVDSTAEDFVFDGAYHVTSETGDSAYITIQTLEDTAALRLLLAGGEMSGNITMAGSETVDGIDISVFAATLDDDAEVVTEAELGDTTANYFDSAEVVDTILSSLLDANIPDGITITQASDVDSTGTDIAAALADRTNIHDTLTMSFSISLIDDTWDWAFQMQRKAITIVRVSGLCKAGTNVIGCLMEYDSDGANPVTCNGAGDWTFTTGEEETTSIDNPSIDADDYLGWKTTSVSGEVSIFTLTIEYTID